MTITRAVAMFFAGFCLIANGAYISIGSLDGIGDCGEMLRTGSPLWTLIAFGGIAVSSGLFVWHRLGSLNHFLSHPSLIDIPKAYLALFVLIVVVVAYCLFDSLGISAGVLSAVFPAGFVVNRN
ncbi:MAG: hypothetical protein O3A00_14360 [Planctomycetota bacterium]|nr:hypothetical protein [Planctomycetota bacterium]